MADKTRVYDMNNDNDIEIVRNLLLADSDDDEKIDESDTDEEEHVSEREGDSESELSAESEPEDESDCTSNDAYVGHLKENRKIIDTWLWYKTPAKKTKRPPRNILLHLPGVIGPAKNITDILDIWNCLITDPIIECIVDETNKYIYSIRPNYSRERDARETDTIEIKALLGLLYLAGLYHGNRLNLEELWKMDDFKTTMSLKRFLFLLRALRFDDISTRAERKETDRLAPIRNIFEKFVNNCQKCYSLGENVTIDEKLEAFRGRCNFIQYIPKKPNKYGIKIYAMVDARMYYTYNMEIYAGKQPEGPFFISNKPRDVVKRLAKPIFNSGRNLTADNWFSDFYLVRELHEKKLSFVGTIRKNKALIPDEFKVTKQREPNTSLFGFKKDMTLVSYVPKKYKNVILVSSMHSDAAIDPETGDKKKPDIVTFYNRTKGGVDTVDKLCATYNVSRNTRRWPLVVFYSMLNVAAINSYIIYLSNNKVQILRRKYLRELAYALMKENILRRAETSTTLQGELKKKVLKRKAELGAEVSEETSAKKRCKPCQNEKRTRITRFTCEICQKFICLEHAKHICSECNTAMQ